MNSTQGKVAVATMGGVAVVSAVLAGAAVWLLVTQPATVATALADHGVGEAMLVVLRTVVTALIRFV
jgi:UDP-N-acetylmuramyl pentapeptide phosphotransferase/UDP-N-acetylglucosamine-1-phosphate transferase